MYFGAVCANHFGTGGAVGLAKHNFLAVLAGLRHARLWFHVVETAAASSAICWSKAWVLGCSFHRYAGIIVWSSRLGHAHYVGSAWADSSLRVEVSGLAPWQRYVVGSPKKDAVAKRMAAARARVSIMRHHLVQVTYQSSTSAVQQMFLTPWKVWSAAKCCCFFWEVLALRRFHLPSLHCHPQKNDQINRVH